MRQEERCIYAADGAGAFAGRRPELARHGLPNCLRRGRMAQSKAFPCRISAAFRSTPDRNAAFIRQRSLLKKPVVRPSRKIVINSLDPPGQTPLDVMHLCAALDKRFWSFSRLH